MTLPFDARALWARALAWYNAYSERDRRVILGIIVATVLSLVYIGIVEPILDYRKTVAASIAQGQEELERSMRFVGAKDSLRAEREDLRKRLAQAKTRLLPGGTATLGAAALQERANALASEKGISVQSTQVMKEENVDPFRKVAVRLTLSGELKPLADFVSGIEYGQQLNVPFIEINRRGAVAGAKGPRTLSVTVEVSGFVQGGETSKPEGAEGEGTPAIEAAPTVEAQADATAGGDASPSDADAGTPQSGGAPAAGAPPVATAPPAAGGPPIATAPSTDGGTPSPGAAPASPPSGAASAGTPPSAPGLAAGATTPTTTAPAAAGSSAPPVAITFPPMVIPTSVPPPTAPAPAASEEAE